MGTYGCICLLVLSFPVINHLLFCSSYHIHVSGHWPCHVPIYMAP